MLSSLYFQICSSAYILLLIFIYFKKRKIETLENNLYSILVITSFLGLVLDIMTTSMALIDVNISGLNFLCKLYLVYLIAWIILFTIYIYIISFKKKESIYQEKHLSKKIKLNTGLLFLICVIIVFILPLYNYSKDGVIYTYGPSALWVYFVCAIATIVMIVFMLLNYKKVKTKKYMPLVAYVILMIIAALIQFIRPEILIVTSVTIFITFFMYFTIENPDMKMIEQLNLAKEQSEKANKAKTEFLSNMSHEIRTPLNAIVGFSQTLMDDENVPLNVKDEVKDIVIASDNLLEIVNGILDISKIEANKLEIINTEYNLNTILKELVILTKTRIGEKNVEIKTNFDSMIPAVLYGDQLRIKQIILNLLTNAAKYTKEGYILFNVNVVKKDDICRIIVSVEDTGIGIKPEKIDKLFTKFERLGIEKENTVEGTGLGLAITKKLVELMNGKIVVQSKYGNGSKFTVAIDQRIVSEKPLEVKKENIKIEAKNFIDKKILVVDDNQLNLKVASLLLKKYNVTVETVNSGFECIEKIKSGNKYDLVLLDDMMPKMSGVETLKKLKEDSAYNIPTIALTANAISGMREKYLSEGFNDYLSKPIEKNELDRVINKFL